MKEAGRPTCNDMMVAVRLHEERSAISPMMSPGPTSRLHSPGETSSSGFFDGCLRLMSGIAARDSAALEDDSLGRFLNTFAVPLSMISKKFPGQLQRHEQHEVKIQNRTRSFTHTHTHTKGATSVGVARCDGEGKACCSGVLASMRHVPLNVPLRSVSAGAHTLRA